MENKRIHDRVKEEDRASFLAMAVITVLTFIDMVVVALIIIGGSSTRKDLNNLEYSNNTQVCEESKLECKHYTFDDVASTKGSVSEIQEKFRESSTSKIDESVKVEVITVESEDETVTNKSTIQLQSVRNTSSKVGKNSLIRKEKPKTKNKKQEEKSETINIFIGDSRFVGMNTVTGISNMKNNYMIAKVGEGYSYLKNTAVQSMNSIINSADKSYNIRVIICLGVNDLGNLDKYVDYYNELDKSNIELYLVSVNPIEYHSYITNKDIEEFNSELQKIDGITYIDTYSYLMSDGFSTWDGLHYSNDTYKKIYNYITDNL